MATMATMAQSVREGAKCARAPVRVGKLSGEICRADKGSSDCPPHMAHHTILTSRWSLHRALPL
eukprot:5601404-Prymnesium_polylepis.1